MRLWDGRPFKFARMALAMEKPHRIAMRLFEIRSDFVLYTLNEDPQPQVLFTFGFSNLKPAPSSVST